MKEFPFFNPLQQTGEGWEAQEVNCLPHKPEDLAPDLQGKGGCGGKCFRAETGGLLKGTCPASMAELISLGSERDLISKRGRGI